jgi:hypothetical protein
MTLVTYLERAASPGEAAAMKTVSLITTRKEIGLAATKSNRTERLTIALTNSTNPTS